MTIRRSSAVLLLPLMGCLCLAATDKKKIKPKEGVVILFNDGNSHLSIDAIDGGHNRVKPHGIYELTPGDHSVRAHLYYQVGRMTWESHTYVDYPFTATGGMVLNVVCHEFEEPNGDKKWRMWIEDVASGKDIHDPSFRAAELEAAQKEHELQLQKNFAETMKKAEQGDLEAQYNLGLCFERGDGIFSDPAESAKWYLKAGERGHATAQFMLGMNYDSGKGVPVDPAEAFVWLSLAALSGDPSAPYFRDEDEKLLSPEQLVLAKARLKKLDEEIRARKSGQ